MKSNIDKFVQRLWRHTCLRASGVPESVLKGSGDLVRKSVVGFNPVQQQEEVSLRLFNHILEHTSQFYEPPFCLTCKKLVDCELQKNGTCDSCKDYQMEAAAYDTCKTQLYRSVGLLHGVFGFDSNRMRLALDRLLGALKSSAMLAYITTACYCMTESILHLG